MSKPVVNGRFLSQPLTGVQRFAVEICRELVAISPQMVIVVPYGTKCVFDELEPHLAFYGNRKGSLWEQTDLASYMQERGGVLLNLCNTAPIRYKNNVVTIHDVGVFRNKQWYGPLFALWYRFMTPRILKKATRILTVSEFSKAEIQSIFNIDRNRIDVVYNGVAKELIPGGDVAKEKLVLHVGTFSKRKNIGLIVKAFLKAKPKGYKLILCGKMDGNLSNDDRLQSTENIEYLKDVTDEELSRLYSKARYFISASHYEGFGLPVLESIIHGSTPILSDIPVFRELYSEGSLFFDPNNLDELAEVFSGLPDECSSIRRRYSSVYKERLNYSSSAQKVLKVILES